MERMRDCRRKTSHCWPSCPGRPNWRLVLLPIAVLLLAAPLLLGYDLQVVALNAFGFGWAGWLVRRILLDRLQMAARRRRR